MAIADAQPADGAALRALHVRTWMAAFRDRVPDANYRSRLAAHRVRDWVALVNDQVAAGGGVLVARDSEEIVGLCQYGPTEDADDDPRVVGHVHRLYVDPLRHRQGIGRSLLATATARMQAQGRACMTLWVLEIDDGARAFYARLGWKPDGGRRADGAVDVRYRLIMAEDV